MLFFFFVIMYNNEKKVLALNLTLKKIKNAKPKTNTYLRAYLLNKHKNS